MPKKATPTCPVLDVFQKEAAKAAAVAVLHKAIRDGTLSPESQHLLEAIREDLTIGETPKRNGRTSKTEKDSVIPAASFQPLNNEPTS